MCGEKRRETEKVSGTNGTAVAVTGVRFTRRTPVSPWLRVATWSAGLRSRYNSSNLERLRWGRSTSAQGDSDRVVKLDPSSRLRVAERKTDNLTPDSFGTFADAGHFERSGRHQPKLPSGVCLTEFGVSGQRQLSVGGAITHFRHRSLREAASTRKAARGYATTVGFRRTNLRFAQERTSATAVSAG
jgi:hypothetical protein